MTARPTILCDVDGILVDFSSAYLDLVYETTGRRHHQHEVHDFDFRKSIVSAEEDAAIWRHIAARPGFVYGLPTYEGWQGFLDELRGLGRVVACTAPAGALWTAERYAWLVEMAGFDKKDVVVTADKGLVHGDVLIDDAHHNIKEWEAGDSSLERTGMLFDRPWNAKLAHHTVAYGHAHALEILRDWFV